MEQGTYNVDTGEFMTREEYLTSDFSPKGYGRDESGRNAHVFRPNGPWATFRGFCQVRLGGITKFHGTAVKLGTTSNSEETPSLLTGLFGRYQAQGFRWITTWDIDGLDTDQVKHIFRHIPDDFPEFFTPPTCGG